ncbi:MAG TPA: NAD(P)/FAD-dependent oxidoreductase [Rhizomicrobium sp.]|nr:NAD(P)/FAD-dependent oxidoreductase [Rhizomicrobium sp.]
MAANKNAVASAPYQDVVVVGAGLSGIYQLYRMVNAGFSATLLEAGDGVGGVWFWNRYPGARFDSESYTYGFFFSNELFNEWEWSEHFAGQPEIERYVNYTVDKFKLRPFIRLGARVASITFDEETRQWTTVTKNCEAYRSKYVITALGILSDPLYPDTPGRESFKGEMYHTSRWPAHEVNFEGKRVAAIGSAASAVQAIPIIAEKAAHLTVFQRTPNWCAPLNNRPVTDEEKRAMKGARLKIHNEVQDNYGGFVHKIIDKSALDVPEEERNEHFEYLYKCAGLSNYLANFKDIGTDLRANKLFSDFYANKIRARVKDPELAEKLIPKDHGFGMKRPPMETGYYEAYNRSNVDLIEIKKEPIIRFTETGIETSERSMNFDIIVLATGFDALTGSWNKIDIAGRNGFRLKELWAQGPRTFLGIMSPGFPNFFMVGGPHGTHGNIFRSTEHQINWITDLLTFARKNDVDTVDVSERAADRWTEHVIDMAKNSLAYLADNYASGANVPGKPRAYLLYHAPTVGFYRDKLKAAEKDGYPDLILEKKERAS